MQKETDAAPAWWQALAVTCGLIALGGQGAFMLRVLWLGLGLDETEPAAAAQAWTINLGWLVLFALQHSGMARTGFKTQWTRLLPAALERAVYAAVSGLLLIGLALTWQPLPGEPLWHGPPWLVGLSLAGALAMGLCCLRFAPASFVGLRQAWQPSAEPQETLRIAGPYRYVRHPLMACLLLFLWGHPVMTPTLALLSGGMTLYVLAAIQLEERDLRRRFGTAYDDYRRRVPALIPWRVAAADPDA